ncbi:MAG: lysophospholipid acyltransferase family protein [Streptococcus sp.]
MAKKELFKSRIFGWWIRMCGGSSQLTVKILVQEAIKYPVNMLKKSNRSLIMFPSGSRHSSDVKGGVAVIAKMAKVKIMPVVYQGPRELKGLLTGERVDMNYGNPIDISDLKRLNDENIQEVARRIQSEFDRLDEEALSYQTGKKPNPFTYIYRVPLSVLWLLLQCF